MMEARMGGLWGGGGTSNTTFPKCYLCYIGGGGKELAIFVLHNVCMAPHGLDIHQHLV